MDFSSVMGPGDKDLPRSEISGYQPVSRIGEVVINCFVDAFEYAQIPDDLDTRSIADGAAGDGSNFEHKPMFHDWATVQPGMICLSRKRRTAVYRQYAAVETSMPVIACAACIDNNQERDWFFAGIARSKSVRAPDDGVGPTVDEMFTLSVGGMSTVLNTSGYQIHAGDLIEWTLAPVRVFNASSIKRHKAAPRRIGIQPASVSSTKIIGRALTFAKHGEPLDILLRQG
jgi:hypothetical protein